MLLRGIATIHHQRVQHINAHVERERVIEQSVGTRTSDVERSSIFRDRVNDMVTRWEATLDHTDPSVSTILRHVYCVMGHLQMVRLDVLEPWTLALAQRYHDQKQAAWRNLKAHGRRKQRRVLPWETFRRSPAATRMVDDLTDACSCNQTMGGWIFSFLRFALQSHTSSELAFWQRTCI